MKTITHIPRAHLLMDASTSSRLSPENARALHEATQALHRMAWDISQVAIDLDDCETLALAVIVAYHASLDEAPENRPPNRWRSVPRCNTCGSANVEVGR